MFLARNSQRLQEKTRDAHWENVVVRHRIQSAPARGGLLGNVAPARSGIASGVIRRRNPAAHVTLARSLALAFQGAAIQGQKDIANTVCQVHFGFPRGFAPIVRLDFRKYGVALHIERDFR